MINALPFSSAGGASYAKNLLSALSHSDTKNEYVVLRTPWQKFWGFPLGSNFQMETVNLPRHMSNAFRVLWEQVRMPRLITESGIDVLLSPADITSLRAPCPAVLVMQHQNLYTQIDRTPRQWARHFLLRRLAGHSVEKARIVVCISSYMADIVSSSFGVPRDKVTVVHNGIDPSLCRTQESDTRLIAEPYFLSVVSAAKHKNVPFLLNVFAQLRRDMSLRNKLCVVGPKEDVSEWKRIWQTATDLGVEDEIIWLEDLSIEELGLIYRQAELFIYPSLAEGFGLPLLEAMCLGLPIVASNTTSIPEIAGDAALYFDPQNLDDATRKVKTVLQNAKLRKTLVKNGNSRVRLFSWEKSAAEIQSLIELAAADRQNHGDVK